MIQKEQNQKFIKWGMIFVVFLSWISLNILLIGFSLSLFYHLPEFIEYISVILLYLLYIYFLNRIDGMKGILIGIGLSLIPIIPIVILFISVLIAQK